jgi:hypothetical protein
MKLWTQLGRTEREGERGWLLKNRAKFYIR